MLSGAPSDYMVEYQNCLREFLLNIQRNGLQKFGSCPIDL